VLWNVGLLEWMERTDGGCEAFGLVDAGHPDGGLHSFHSIRPPKPKSKPKITKPDANRRQWYLRGVASGGDASWGILSRCMGELGVCPTELEDPRWLVMDVAMNQR
jgi:hypothetical protein